ncbi:TPA: hypothetical protein GRI96_18975 [Vibrio parahaemolyticus]|uniref:hypothetical protein n=1 Tax=Vibrio parahaemolyticus TaxID=670 RepID=UPI000AB048EA|nr:hypothetical protein [Vibrio parahaemolyticus]EGR1984929.1 hypothetical protein [Vibrio parahaemolyticus]OXD31807.1 hypothetical protein CA164_11595 [Vibrio parahaemolyticus]HAS6808591.1 hypothetical protein [Vibrio parahaemolyticus]HAS6823122.1 hypothetical protein [Vibrio parahaemolyticus]
MKSIRFFHRRYNFTSNQKDRSRCERSLMHSLRIVTEANTAKQFEWDENLSDSNLIWRNGETLLLNSLSDERKEQLLFTTAPTPLVRDHTKLQTRHRQYRKKIKTAITAEYKNGNDAAAKFLEEILDSSGHVSYSKIDLFKTMVMSRKNQRVKMLETYLDAHNQTQSRPNLNCTFIQEGIFKIPHQWKVSSEQISLHEYVDFTVKFLTHHFPDYPIKMVIGHDDERDAEENTGAHTHYFLSARNTITGEFDLLRSQKIVVNQYMEKVGLKDKALPVGWRLRELIGRGRRETLDRDLRQLVEQGQITIEDKSSIESQQPTIQVEPTVILPLPVEIQEALKLIEGQLSSSLVNLVIQLNTLTDTHYEHLTRTRLLESKALVDEALSKQQCAEEKLVVAEERVRLQVELNEQLEQDCTALEEQLALARLHGDEHLAALESMTNENASLLSDLETYQQNESLQNEQIQALTRQNTVLETQLDNCRTEAVKQCEANGLLQAEEKSLARLDELTAQLAESQTLAAVLSERVIHLESSLKTHEVVT